MCMVTAGLSQGCGWLAVETSPVRRPAQQQIFTHPHHHPLHHRLTRSDKIVALISQLNIDASRAHELQALCYVPSRLGPACCFSWEHAGALDGLVAAGEVFTAIHTLLLAQALSERCAAGSCCPGPQSKVHQEVKVIKLVPQ